MPQVPIAERLFTWPSDDPRLLGSRCGACSAHAFPAQASCPACAAGDCEVVELSPTGTIWTWTSQEFLPKSPPYAGREDPATFQRYYVAYVELEGELRVESRLTGFEDAEPRIGQRVRLRVVPFGEGADGSEIMIPTFEPAEEA